MNFLLRFCDKYSNVFYQEKLQKIHYRCLDYSLLLIFADGCTGECATKEGASAEDSRDGRGAVYYLAAGPSLLEEFGTMAPIME